jgi:hypothetical protein
MVHTRGLEEKCFFMSDTEIGMSTIEIITQEPFRVNQTIIAILKVQLCFTHFE